MAEKRLISHEQAFTLICEALGEDLDAPVCVELGLHLKKCPSCRAYFESVKTTVRLYQHAGVEIELPDAVTKRLSAVLQL